MAPRLFAVRWLLTTVVALAPLYFPAPVEANGQKQVLVLYSTRRDSQIALVAERELPKILAGGLQQELDYYSEYIDRARFQDPAYKSGFRDFLRLKYKGVAFDVVIAMQDIALEFIGENRNEVFPGTPVVFFSSSSRSVRRLPNSTGVVAPLNFGGTVDLAGQLQPDLRRVFVVTGAELDDRTYEDLVRSQLRSLEPRFEITYLSGLPTPDLERRLATLPEHSSIYYILVNQDGAGANFHPLEYLDRLGMVANQPIYSWVDSAMDHGIVGGSLKDQNAQTEALGLLALRVLRGEAADSIPTSSPNLNVNQVDWRQLRRWGLSESRVPAGTIVKFREPSAWDRDKLYIIGAAAILLAQTLLIAGLLVHRAKRRQAEEQVRGGEAALRISYERIHDLGSRLLDAQERERSRIARELHDDIGQQMALLTIDLELLSSAGHDERQQFADEAVSRAHGLAKSVHDLSHRLHPAKLRLIGLVSALQALQHELSPSGTTVTFTHDNVPPALPPDITLCLFRVVQEALQNALKYSGARAVSVHLCGDETDRVSLTIMDDGIGFDVDGVWGKGLGLISMSERLEAIGGTFRIRSRPGEGTLLEITAPLQLAHKVGPAAV